MTVSITKVKTKTAPAKVEAIEKSVPDKETLKEMTIEQVADRYGTLKDQVDAAMMNPVFTQFAEVDKELKERLKGFPAEDELEITGEHFTLEIGACTKCPAEIKDIMKVRKMLGEKTFMALVKINLGDLKKYLNPEQLKEVLNEDTGRTPNRKITPKFRG